MKCTLLILLATILGLLAAGCSPLRNYRLATYGPGDTSAGDLTHVSQPGARVVIPRQDKGTTALAPLHRTAITGCDATLEAHVYHPARLKALGCATVTGTIADATGGRMKDGCKHERDGDGHCFLKLDPGQEQYLNDANLKNEHGYLVFEPMCRYRVTQADARASCRRWRQKLAIPPAGSHVKLTGQWVTDTEHGHNELHPVTSIEIVKP